jgi:exodeoxyribonuclease V alpha subunit
VEPVSSRPDPRAEYAADVLAPFVRAGVVGEFERHLVEAVLRQSPEAGPSALVALALAARAPRFGHVCVEPAGVRTQVTAAIDPTDGLLTSLPWPDPVEWGRELEESAIVAPPARALDQPLRPLVWDGTRIYLQRHWYDETVVADDMIRRAAGTGTDVDRGTSLETTLDRLFGTRTADPDLQREAVGRALVHRVAIIAGGPGTGKTYALVRLLAAAHLVARAEDRGLVAALAAPTGKAAARMGEAVRAQLGELVGSGAVDDSLAATLGATDPTTVHRLLGRGDRAHFRHGRSNPLPHDLVIVDETSMVSLSLMARLLEAVRPEARLVLVGDPHQLTSIEAGTIMADVVGPVGDTASGGTPDAGDTHGGRPRPLAGRVTQLRRMRRFTEDSAIATLADAVRTGDADGAVAVLSGGLPDARWVRTEDPGGEGSSGALMELRGEVVAVAIEVAEAAVAGAVDAALDAAGRIKVLAAVRRGPYGVDDWGNRIEEAVAAAVPLARGTGRWRLGMPVIVTGNDQVNRVFNGDTGVVVAHEGGVRVALATGEGARLMTPARLGEWEPWWAMTIHKSQGSEFPHAVVSLPASGSPVLTRELLYTAVTRAVARVTVVGDEDTVRAAIARPAARASGLRDRLWPSSP